MNLSDLATSLVRQEHFGHRFRWSEAPEGLPGLDQTEMFSALAEVVEDPSRRRVLVSACLWNSLFHVERFRERIGARAGREDSRESREIIVFHQAGNLPRLDLLVFTREPTHRPPSSVRLPQMLDEAGVRPAQLVEGMNRWAEAAAENLYRGGGEGEMEVEPEGTALALELVDQASGATARAFAEVVAKQPFSVLFAPLPKTERTHAVASPAWGITVDGGAGTTSTAGVFTADAQGRSGVTGCLHGLVDDPDALPDLFAERGAACVVGRPAYVEGALGVVRSADLITDSCFIELDSERAHVNLTKVQPLVDLCPREREPVRFEGFGLRGVQSTFVTGMDRAIPLVLRNQQACVYTQAVTSPGDSGCALLDGEDHVLGFSFYRTGLNEPIEFSQWIWAASVFRALRLAP